MKLSNFITILLCCFSWLLTAAQSGESIHFDQISQKKVRSLLKKEQIENKADFKKMQPSCYEGQTQEGYSRHIFTLTFQENIGEVWAAYKSLNPKELGLGEIITFGLSYSRKNDKLIYAGDDGGKIEEGQIIISGLRYLGGFVKLAVAQEVTEINESEKFITFCYMQNGKTNGSQQIRFSETADGGTEIVHVTFFRSKSKFRDKKLYPGLHEKTIVELHENMRRKIKSGGRDLAARKKLQQKPQ